MLIVSVQGQRAVVRQSGIQKSVAEERAAWHMAARKQRKRRKWSHSQALAPSDFLPSSRFHILKVL